jgi:hypothetical protein
MEVGIISGLVVLAVAAFAVWLWEHLLKLTARKAPSAGRWTIRATERRVRALLLQRRVRAARHVGMSVVTKIRRGGEFATITWKGAVEIDTYRYYDLPTYKRVQMTGGRTMPTRTSCCGRPPRVGHREKLMA